MSIHTLPPSQVLKDSYIVINPFQRGFKRLWSTILSPTIYPFVLFANQSHLSALFISDSWQAFPDTLGRGPTAGGKPELGMRPGRPW